MAVTSDHHAARLVLQNVSVLIAEYLPLSGTWFPRERWTPFRQLCAGTRLHPRAGGVVNCEILAQPAVGGQPLWMSASRRPTDTRDRTGQRSHEGGTPGGAAYMSRGDRRRSEWE
jgi:hypothetical protein